MLLSHVLQSRGWDVVECGDAEAGWRALRTGTFPLVLLNWMLPGETGLDLCRRLRADPSGAWADTVVLVITGRSEAGALKQVLEAG